AARRTIQSMVPRSAAAAFEAFDTPDEPARLEPRPAAGTHGVALTFETFEPTIAAHAPARPPPPPGPHGVALPFETFEPTMAADAPVRVRPAEDILLRVIDGLVRLTV